MVKNDKIWPKYQNGHFAIFGEFNDVFDIKQTFKNTKIGKNGGILKFVKSVNFDISSFWLCRLEDFDQISIKNVKIDKNVKKWSKSSKWSNLTSKPQKSQNQQISRNP